MLLVLSFLVLAAGCRSGGKRAPGTIDGREAEDIADQISMIKQVYHLCPSPAEMLSVIDVADLDFDQDLLNPVDNVDKYLDTKSRTISLGVYITDLAYAAIFGRHEETLDYLDAVRSVAEEIRLTGAINDDLVRKARQNVEYLDSLFDISNEAFINMLFYCESNNRPNTIVLLSAGAFVESLYLAVNLFGEYEESAYILQHLADQKYAIDNLMAFAESLRDEDENIAAVMEEMKAISEIFSEIDPGGSDVTITTQEDAGDEAPKKIVIGGGDSSPPALSPQVFEKLKKETIRLRELLVNV